MNKKKISKIIRVAMGGLCLVASSAFSRPMDGSRERNRYRDLLNATEYGLDVLSPDFKLKFHIGNLSFSQNAEGAYIVPLHFSCEKSRGVVGDAKAMMALVCPEIGQNPSLDYEPHPLFDPFELPFLERMSRFCHRDIIFLIVGSGSFFFRGFYKRLVVVYADGRKSEEYHGGVFSDKNVQDYLEQDTCKKLFLSKHTMTFIYHKEVDEVFYCLPCRAEIRKK
jgi:hypothetical protein